MNKTKGKSKPAINPAKQKIQLGVLGVLLLIAVTIGGVQLQQGKASPTRTTQSPAAALPNNFNKVTPLSAVTVANEQPRSLNAESLIDLPVTWPMTLRRDPFVWSRLNAPITQVTQAAPNHQAIEAQARAQLKLQGVMLDQNPRVLVNGMLLQLGAQVSGYEIKQIEKRAIIVTRQGVDVRISL